MIISFTVLKVNLLIYTARVFPAAVSILTGDIALHDVLKLLTRLFNTQIILFVINLDDDAIFDMNDVLTKSGVVKELMMGFMHELQENSM